MMYTNINMINPDLPHCLLESGLDLTKSSFAIFCSVYRVRGGGALLYKPIRDVPFFRVSFFKHKFLNRV